MSSDHRYHVTITWTGNKGRGTESYTSYDRSHEISIQHKAVISGSSDPAFRGDATRHNPEDLLLASLSSCHMLWYLHLCSAAGVIVLDYVDGAEATMVETDDGGGRFVEANLNPVVTVADSSMVERAYDLHKKANELCFIANSVNFPVRHQPVVQLPVP
ncbi:organic hydroperoxide reductase OsmC/OhrA [Sphingobacterium allocomposti]|jgi:organic hydroperoxide reductase OsmC/OhrA|uniref:Organic hydroperoxide reductase OsmC/OhrA n=1 Tax=Sphingobacterium allocomposti TaxID=415956 RepID=A0A5S5D9N3_9SPHI|nr:OsmC family protein [Sphingobacterium composti Yoo et al. 2007 non Ten et al. 2007]TYP92234.1 organic hydroperoxide reductase OsmC/OhrA [Sphingobacterium composti Yoo et al. 2007 non Ten et al. 2007]